MYPVVKGTFKANLTITEEDEQGDSISEPNEHQEDKQEDEEKSQENQSRRRVTPSPTPTERNPEQEGSFRYRNSEGDLDANEWYHKHNDEMRYGKAERSCEDSEEKAKT